MCDDDKSIVKIGGVEVKGYADGDSFNKLCHGIDVTFNQDEIRIENKVTGANGIMKRHYTEIITLKEQKIRDALIALGWTPPKEDK